LRGGISVLNGRGAFEWLFCPERREFATSFPGTLGTRLGNLNKPIFNSSNARGGCPGEGEMLKLQFDWYIN